MLPTTKVTLNEIITAVRELTFDRFIIPAFAIKQMPNHFITITEDSLTIRNTTEDTTEQPKEFLFSTYTTMETLLNALIDSGIVVAYTPYFKGDELSTSLVKVKEVSLDSDYTAFRRYFFSDEDIKKEITWYYYSVLRVTKPELELNDDLVGLLKRPSEKHLTIWVAYHMVDRRRLYENASQSIGQTFTDGSDYTGSVANSTPSSTTVQIGSVFSITENAEQGFFQEDFNRVGSDNIWGDRYSFWYKLMLYLRQLLEEMFRDFSLRKDNVLVGQIDLIRELDFRSYYDSYPFTISPLSRGILSKTP